MYKGGDDGLHLVEMPLEEVVCALDDHHAFRRGHMFKPRGSQAVGRQLILCSLDNELGFVTIHEILCIKHASRYSQANHCLDTVIDASDLQRYICAE